MKILTIILSILVVFSITGTAFLWIQNNKTELQINELKSENDTLQVQINELKSENDTLQVQKGEFVKKVTELDQQLKQVLEKVAGYLLAEGRTVIPGTGVRCEQEPEQCLVYWEKLLTGTTGPKCDVVSDGVCPAWCATGSDHDCCLAKQGYTWIQGRGCYSNP